MRSLFLNIILSNGSSIYVKKRNIISLEKYSVDQYNVPFWDFNVSVLQNEAFSSQRSKFKKRVKKVR